MKYSRFSLLILMLISFLYATAQSVLNPVFKGATKANRDKTYQYIIKQSITENLSVPLTDSTEENWEEAFYGMELIHYKQLWVNEKVKTAFNSVDKRSGSFQRALMELLYTNYTTDFKNEVNGLFLNSPYPKVFAMCAEYLLRTDRSPAYASKMKEIILTRIAENFEQDSIALLITGELLQQFSKPCKKNIPQNLAPLLKKNWLPGNPIVYSIQRKNRSYPGIVIVRDSNGVFIKNDTGNIFFVQQLARSITNMPSYLTNGNTPQGIFRMLGFAVSKSPALGPTQNIQLTMPLETTIQQFLKDSSITDSVWTPELYEQLLPASLKKYHPLFQSYYASAIGRTEIIAHGTTVNPAYYKGETYYPYTPTQGCLCTKEIWSEADGKRLISDQQKLVDAVKKAGGPDGYLIVIEIDDQQKPVGINEILPYLKSTK